MASTRTTLMTIPRRKVWEEFKALLWNWENGYQPDASTARLKRGKADGADR
jgi:hypothetical protein